MQGRGQGGVPRGAPGATRWPGWREAMTRSLYGRDGFHRQAASPSRHFRTSAHVGDGRLLARAVLALLLDVDESLDRPGRLDLVDLGAGGGELARAVHEAAAGLPLAERLVVSGVDLRPRPADLPEAVGWSRRLPGRLRGLVVANEYLDNVPVEVAAGTPSGPRLVTVAASGREVLGGSLRPADLAWLQRWWPPADGERAEVGGYRDMAWAAAVGALDAGMALAADYGHLQPARLRGDHGAGTLGGYRDGRRCTPAADGSCDLTAHVAMDAVAEAGTRAGATATLLTTQRAALRALLDGPTAQGAGATALQASADLAELTNPTGLGGFTWLVQAKGCPLPVALAGDAEGAGQRLSRQ